MKIKHYNDAIDWLTRPKFNGGGSVKNKEVLPKRKPEEELKKRKKKRFEKLKEYLENPEEVEEMLELQDGGRIGFANGGTFLDEKTFRELYEKFPGGTDSEFLEFVKKEGEAKGIKYTGQAGAELNPRSIQNRRQNVLKIPKKGGLPFKLSPKEFRKRAKEFGINTRGLTDEEIRRKVQNKASSLAVKKRFAEDPEYRESKRERIRQTREKFKTNDPEKYRKYLQSVQASRLKSGRTGRFPTELTPKGYFWGDLVFNAQEFKSGRLKNSHIKYASPNTKMPKTADATNKIKLIDTNVKDPKTGKSKVLTYDNFLEHIDDNQNLYRIDSKTALGEYKKKEFINKNPDLKKGLIKELYDIDIADKDLYEGGKLKKGIAPFKRAPFHMHHTAGRGANAFNVQFAVGSENIAEGRARKIFDTDFKLAKNFGEQKAAVKKYLDSIPENLEVRLKNTPYGTRETLKEMTERVAPKFSKNIPTQLNAKLPIISTMYDVAKSIPGDIGKAKYLSAGFKTLGLAVAPYVAYTTFQDVAAGKNLVEALERNLIGTDIIGGTKDILAMSPEEREARAKVKQEQIAELNIDMPTGFGFIEAPPVQTDMSLEEAKQKFEAGKQRVAKERAETEAGVAAMRKQAFDNLKDTVTGNRAMAVELAGGGLLKQAGKRSGPPPEKGPGGLASLEDYARTMME